MAGARSQPTQRLLPPRRCWARGQARGGPRRRAARVCCLLPACGRGRPPTCRLAPQVSVRAVAAEQAPSATANQPYGRVFNFSAGPAVLPVEVLEQAQADLLNWRGCGEAGAPSSRPRERVSRVRRPPCDAARSRHPGRAGMSVMEMSHRGKEFQSIIDAAEADLRALLAIPDNYQVLFMQGGASSQFSAIPLNLAAEGDAVDYIVTGSWSKKAAGGERCRHARASRHVLQPARPATRPRCGRGQEVCQGECGRDRRQQERAQPQHVEPQRRWVAWAWCQSALRCSAQHMGTPRHATSSGCLRCHGRLVLTASVAPALTRRQVCALLRQ